MPVRALRAATVVLASLLAVAVAAPASAHVTVRTDNPTPGGFGVYTVRVPNERDDAATTQIEVAVPDGVEISRYEPLDGWDITVSEDTLTMTGGTIEPGQFQDFRFSGRSADDATELRFAAIQTYDSDEVVEWTGDEDSETPASVVMLAAAGEVEEVVEGVADEAMAAAESAQESAEEALEMAAAAAEDAEGSGSATGLAVAALAAGLLGLALGGAAFVRGGRSTA